MAKQALYRDFAYYYDLIYSKKDYEKESQKIMRLIARYKKSPGKELLEVGCGSGKHLAYFREKFDCTGMDFNKGILAVARANVKNVRYVESNMVTFDLGQQFDVITSLFSAIGYVKTYANLRKTIQQFARHLKPGGVVIIEPWFSPDTYKSGAPHMSTYDDYDLKIARLTVSVVRKSVSVMDMHYLIAERGKKVRHVVDRHELGLFTHEKTLQCMSEVGLEARFLKNGLLPQRGLFIGVKR